MRRKGDLSGITSPLPACRAGRQGRAGARERRAGCLVRRVRGVGVRGGWRGLGERGGSGGGGRCGVGGVGGVGGALVRGAVGRPVRGAVGRERGCCAAYGGVPRSGTGPCCAAPRLVWCGAVRSLASRGTGPCGASPHAGRGRAGRTRTWGPCRVDPYLGAVPGGPVPGGRAGWTRTWGPCRVGPLLVRPCPPDRRSARSARPLAGVGRLRACGRCVRRHSVSFSPPSRTPRRSPPMPGAEFVPRGSGKPLPPGYPPPAPAAPARPRRCPRAPRTPGRCPSPRAARRAGSLPPRNPGTRRELCCAWKRPSV
ncbi:hypothetical protein GA0115251_10327 [Streptomyces sp. TverLS-915]|nr:hypothetical protein GA0115251_10327 [Streptomyces sp. TverLS-915]